MAQDNWWENDAVAGQPATPGQITIGAPKPKKPEIRQVGNQLGVVDDSGNFTPTYTAPEKPSEADAKAADGERKAAGFLRRAIGAYNTYGKLNMGPRSLAGEVLHDNAPGILNTLPDAIGNSDERRLADQAELEFISAALRQDSGATIPPEEIAAQRPTWFPRAGSDSPEVLANLDQARRREIEALIVAAGKAVDPELQRLIEEFRANPPAAPTGEGNGFAPVLNDKGQPLLEVDVEGGRQPTIEEIQANPDQYREYQRLHERLNQTDAFGAGLAGVADAATFGFSDEIAAGLNAFGGAMSGQGSFGDLYGQNIGLERAYAEALAGRNPYAYTGGQLVGGAAIPFGAGAQGVRGLAALGATQGGLYGLGSGEGNILERAPGGFTGAALGGAVGAGLGAAQPHVANALNRYSQRPSVALRQHEAADAVPIIEAGQRQNIPIRQPDARPSTRADFAAVEASQSGNPIVTRTLQADQNAVQGRVREVGGQGRVLDDFETGQRVQRAGNNYLARTRNQANALYGRAEQMAGNASGDAPNAMAAIDAHINDLRATGERTNAGAIKYLEDLKADIGGGNASIAKLRNIRSNVRGQINERNLTATDTERRVGEVLDAMGQDIETMLPANAKAAFRSADDFYRQRMEFKSQVIERFIGPKNNPISPEQAAARFNSFMKSKDYGRFQRMMKELEPQDREDIAATVAENLGLARNGEFSLAALATNIEKLSPRAVKELFGDDGARALADLRIIARAKADTAGALNRSRTGVVAERNGLRDVLFGIFGGGIAGIPGAAAGFFARGTMEKLSNGRAARLLLNPDFTKWLRQTPQTANPAAINRHFSRLSQVAARDTVFAADVKALQQFLADSFSSSPVRAAASQEEDN